MICTSCGAANRDDAQFCRNCGNALADPLSPPSITESPTLHLPPDPLAGYSSPLKDQQNDPTGYSGYLSPQAPSSEGLSNPSYAPYQPPLPQKASGRAVTSLVLSILSWFTCGPLFSIPAMILGKMEMNAINAGQASAAGMGHAKAGFWIGLIVTIIFCGGVALMTVFGILGSVLESIGAGVQ